MPKITLLTSGRRIMMLPNRKVNFTSGRPQNVTEEEAQALLRLRENEQPVFKAEAPEPEKEIVAGGGGPVDIRAIPEDAKETGQNVSGRPIQNALGI